MNVQVSFVAVVCLVCAFCGCGGASPPHYAEVSDTAESTQEHSEGDSFETLREKFCKKSEECRDVSLSECEGAMNREIAKVGGVCRSEWIAFMECFVRQYDIPCQDVDLDSCDGLARRHGDCVNREFNASGDE